MNSLLIFLALIITLLILFVYLQREYKKSKNTTVFIWKELVPIFIGMLVGALTFVILMNVYPRGFFIAPLIGMVTIEFSRYLIIKIKYY